MSNFELVSSDAHYGGHIRPEKLMTSLIFMFWPHVHPRNANLGHSLYDLIEEVFYALACSYLIFCSSIV